MDDANVSAGKLAAAAATAADAKPITVEELRSGLREWEAVWFSRPDLWMAASNRKHRKWFADLGARFDRLTDAAIAAARGEFNRKAGEELRFGHEDPLGRRPVGPGRRRTAGDPGHHDRVGLMNRRRAWMIAACRTPQS